MNIKTLLLTTVLTLVTAFGTLASAGDHPIRILPNTPPLGHLWVPVGDGKVGFFLGLRVEPGYVLEPNGVEIYVGADAVYDENGELMDYRYINEADNDPNDPSTHPEDKARVSATVYLQAWEDINSPVLAKKKLGKLKLRNAEVGYYLNEFIPNPDGAYAFRLKGEINGQKFNKKIVCSTGEAHSFSCVSPYRQDPLPEVF